MRQASHHPGPRCARGAQGTPCAKLSLPTLFHPGLLAHNRRLFDSHWHGCLYTQCAIRCLHVAGSDRKAGPWLIMPERADLFTLSPNLKL